MTRHEIHAEFCDYLNAKNGEPLASTNPTSCTVDVAVEFMDNYLFRSRPLTIGLDEGFSKDSKLDTPLYDTAREILIAMAQSTHIEVSDAKETVNRAFALATAFLEHRG